MDLIIIGKIIYCLIIACLLGATGLRFWWPQREEIDPDKDAIEWVKNWRRERGLKRVEPTFSRSILIPLSRANTFPQNCHKRVATVLQHRCGTFASE
jgi:hypothetical protein